MHSPQRAGRQSKGTNSTHFSVVQINIDSESHLEGRDYTYVFSA